MNILFELLSELKYQTKKSFTFDISSDEDKTPIVVTPFVSVEYPCQTYLVIETENQASLLSIKREKLLQRKRRALIL